MDQIVKLAGAQAGAAGSTADLAGQTEALADAHHEAASALRDHYLAELALADGLLGVQGAALSAKDAELSLEAAQKRVNDLAKDGKQGTLEYRQAVNEAKSATLNAVTSHLALAQTVADYVIELEGADASQRDATRTVKEFAAAAGLTKGETRRLIDEVLGLVRTYDDVPGTVETKVKADTAAATQAIIGYKAMLASIAPTLTTTALFRAPTGGGFGQVAAGAIIKAQAGIVRRPTMIRPGIEAGEGPYFTEFGRGAEGVLPLTEAVFDQMGRAIARHMPKGGGQLVVVPVMMSDELDRRTYRTVRDALIPRSGR